jgi:hypothetical protein
VSDNSEHSKQSSSDYRIPAGSAWQHAWKMAAAVGVVGLVIGAFGYTLDPRRFAFSYLMGFFTVLTMLFGSMFFVLIQHLTFAGWSVTVRRTSEFFVAGAIIVPLLALPNLLGREQLYPWWNHGAEGVAHAQEHGPASERAPARARVGRERGAEIAEAHGEEVKEVGETGPEHSIEEKVVSEKLPYLNSTFFYLRAVLYFLAWLWLAARLFGYSTAQDKNGDPQWTVKLQSFAPKATFVFALTLTFAAFDWLMSLMPTWYSTMFGVRVFAASVVLALALNILVSLGLRKSGAIKDEINVEHFHDLGKLMFAFLVFWGYISFSEFFLIWYAAIPEETAYFHLRWDNPTWMMVSVSIVAVKFIIPFFMVMSRNAKRSFGLIGLGAAWIVTLHLVEMYYWVMPFYHEGHFPFSVTGLMTDLGCIFGCVGIYLAVVFRRMLNHPVIPLRDPRLSRAIDFVNA